MKKILIFSLFISSISQTILAQSDLINDEFHQELAINSKDIIEALKMSGIEIHKFSIGEFDQKYKLTFFLQEYKSDSLIEERILYKGNNTYDRFDEQEGRQTRHVSQIRIITKENENESDMSIYLEGRTLKRQFAFEKTYNRQFFKWIPYENTKYQIDKKVPLMAFISSWKEKNGYIRHCGVQTFTDANGGAKKFFKKSPNYFVFSYLIEKE